MPPDSNSDPAAQSLVSMQAQPAPVFVPQFDPNATEKNIYTEICGNIIKEQNKIIGALAFEQASQVDGLKVDPVTFDCRITGVGAVVVENLIQKYRDFFGHAAVEVCREAASKYLTGMRTESIPVSLRSSS